MSCNVDLLHVGIWTFYGGVTLLLSSALTFRLLTPVEKAQNLKQRNEVRKTLLTQTSKEASPKALLYIAKNLNFSV